MQGKKHFQIKHVWKMLFLNQMIFQAKQTTKLFFHFKIFQGLLCVCGNLQERDSL
jgi:hypothetical protein